MKVIITFTFCCDNLWTNCSHRRVSELFCVALCTEVAHSHKHTLMSSSYSSLDWVLSHWVHFTVCRFICVCVCILCVFVLHCIVVVSM